MRLKMLDQMHISAVNAHVLKAGQEIEVSDVLGAELLKKHPGAVEQIGAKSDGPAPKNKMEAAPDNKDNKPDYPKSTVAELKALAEERKVDLGEAKTKADIIAVLEAADGKDAQQ